MEYFSKRIEECRNGAQPYRLGMAARSTTRAPHADAAAMEPSLIGWEWAAERGWELDPQPDAAMEPSLIGWEWAAERGWELDPQPDAAMEPSLIGWEWRETE